HITSRLHLEAVSGWSPIGPLVSGMGSSLAFTVLTGLAERRVFPLPSASRTGYCSLSLSASGQSRDLQHFSPMLTRCGNSALRDMAHVGVRPIQTNVPHRCDPLSQTLPGAVGSLYNGGGDRNYPPIIDWPRNAAGEDDLSLSVKPCGNPGLSPAVFLEQGATLLALGREGLSKY